MKRSITGVIAAAALAIPGVATAQFDTGQVAPWSATEGYDNRGQCQAFLVRFGNDLRQNPELRDEENRELRANEWNQLFSSQWACTQGEDGRWYVTWQM
jgi:hypothetical protein